jgi:hypothetical protein
MRYLTGLLLDGERKSIEPMAARLVNSPTRSKQCASGCSSDHSRGAPGSAFITTLPYARPHTRSWRSEERFPPGAQCHGRSRWCVDICNKSCSTAWPRVALPPLI